MPDRWFPSIGITVSYFPECWFPKARTLVSRVPEYSGSLSDYLDSHFNSVESSSGTFQYEINGKTLYHHERYESDFNNSNKLDKYIDAFFANLNTEARLKISNPAIFESVRDNNNPIHFAAFNPTIRKWLSDNFRKAFGEGIIPNRLNGNTIPLLISNPIELEEEFENEEERTDALIQKYNSLPKVHEQGDGIRGFVGILLYLMIPFYNVFLIDEPESFLYPPQAKIMGEIIGNTINNNQQAFLATHSDDLIKGLLQVCPNRLKIVHIERIPKQGNSISILDNDRIEDIASDPILKYSNILSSLFYPSVVLCESDSDCKIYSIINDYLRQSEGYYSESFFIHCNGKHRLHKVASALKSLNVSFVIISDLDILNDEKTIRQLIEVCCGKWDDIQKHYSIFASHMRTKWDALKKEGEAAIPSGDSSEAYDFIKRYFNDYGIFIVPVGEVENFIKDVGGHGNAWIDNVLEKHPNLEDKCYDSIKRFIKQMNLI